MARQKNENLGNETKSDKFKRLAEYRVNKVLTTLGQIENLASSQYDKTDEQIDKIEQIIYNTVEMTMNKLRKTKIKDDCKFTL